MPSSADLAQAESHSVEPYLHRAIGSRARTAAQSVKELTLRRRSGYSHAAASCGPSNSAPVLVTERMGDDATMV